MPQQGLLPEIGTCHSCRAYLPDPVSREAIQRILDAGALATSGANQQPWHMVVINSPELKIAIRELCEAADHTFHEHISDGIRQWMQDHEITTEKSFLTEAPALIAVFYDPKAPYPPTLSMDRHQLHAAAGNTRRLGNAYVYTGSRRKGSSWRAQDTVACCHSSPGEAA